MSVEAWALFCVTELILCINPGPSALVVMSQSLTRGAAAGLRATLGVLAANAIYFTLSASGLVAVHSLSSQAFSIIKCCGAAYLAWIGLNLIRSSFNRAMIRAKLPVKAGNPFWRGFVTQGANPNLLVYFTAILPQFINPTHAVAPQVILLACSSFLIESAVLSGYASLSGRAGQATTPRFHAILERVGGGLLIGAAAGLARLERE
jgi:threonine/homoserine/homoserine lactone efflux protein